MEEGPRISDHVTHELSQRPQGVYCATCDLSIPDPQVSMDAPMPVWTDAGDMSRLRPVTSTRGWQPDRDDTDPIRLRALYARMDGLLARGPEVAHGWDEGDYVSLLVEVGQCWSEIRRLMRGN